MLIRSQDREDLVNVDDVSFIRAGQATDGEFNVGICEPFRTLGIFEIGTYSSLEKAKKVLDMIADAYTACDYHAARLRGIDTDDGPKWEYEPRFTFVPPKVFQMPQDDEVEL